jgi:negative regulator of sigma-B (phosphoserine phosphatase)
MEEIDHVCVQFGVAFAALPGQSTSGDRHVVRTFPDGMLVGVVDGLGHGEEASRAAIIAARILENYAGESVIDLLGKCHEGLRRSRGVVMNVALFDGRAHAMTWLGIGNVEGVLFRRDPTANPQREYLVARAGVVGRRFEQPRASVIPVSPGDTLIFATDGVDPTLSVASLSANGQEDPQRIADRILKTCWKRSDDALVLVARYTGGMP